MISTAASVLLLLVVFAPTLRWMWGAWFFGNGYFGHGPLMVLACAWFVFDARKRTRACPRVPSPGAMVPLALCLLLHVAGQALMVDSLSGIALVPALCCVVWAHEGPARLRALAPALGCLLFTIPLPIFVAGKVAYEMKYVATFAAVTLGNLVGLGLTQSGANIAIPGQEAPLVVGDACSGLRSLVALMSLGYVYAFFLTPRRLAGKLCFVAIAVLIALITNFLRIAALAAIASSWGVAVAAGPAHDWSGWLLYLAAIALLFAVDRVLPGRLRPGARPAPAAVERHVARPLVEWGARGLVAFAGIPALWLAVWHPIQGDVRFADRVARETPRFEAIRDHPFPERWYSLIGTRDVVWRRYRYKGSRSFADMTAIFQGTKWKSLHPPEVCLNSAGFEVVEAERRNVQVDRRDVELTVLRVERGSLRFLVGYVFGGADFVTPSFLGFFLRNVPRALFRRDTRGFMLRVDVPWPANTERQAAERTMSAFLGDFLPVMAELIRK